MKESEAKKKWCPHIRTRQNGMNALAVNVFNNEDRPTCIGTACMMWKAEHKSQYAITDEQPNRDDCIPEGKGWEYVVTLPSIDDEPNKIKWRRIVAIDEGTCGLITKEMECGL